MEMNPGWATFFLAAVTTAGMIALSINSWVHRNEETDLGVSAKFREEERLRLERERFQEELRIERATTVSRRLEMIDNGVSALLDRLDAHGKRIRDLELLIDNRRH